MGRFIGRPRISEWISGPAGVVLRHGAAYFVARIVGALLQLALLVYLTHRLGRAGYGEIALFTAAFGIGSTALFNVWRHALVRFLPDTSDDDSARHEVSTIEISLAWAVVGSIAIGLFAVLVSSAIGWPRLVAPGALALALAAGGVVEINLELLRRRLRPMAYAGLFLSRSVLQLCFVVAGVLLQGTATGAIIGLALSHLAAALLVPWRFWKNSLSRGLRQSGPFRGCMSDWRRFLSYAGPISLGELAAVGFLMSDRVMLGMWRGYDDAGLYSAAHDLTWMGLHVISLVAFLSFYPIVLNAHGRDDDAELRRSSAHGGILLFGLSLASTVGVSALAGPISTLVLGNDFEEGAGTLIAILAWVHLIYVAKVYWFDLRFQLALRTWPLLVIGLASLALNILLNFVLIPPYGVTGAALATAVAATAGCAATVAWSLVLPRAHRLRLPLADAMKLVTAAAIMAAALFLSPRIETFAGLVLTVVMGATVFLAAGFALRVSIVARPHTR